MNDEAKELLEQLDEDPTDDGTLDDLIDEVYDDPSLQGEMIARLERGLAVAVERGDEPKARELAWFLVNAAVVLNRLDVVGAVVDGPHLRVPGDRTSDATAAAVLLELGRVEEAEGILSAIADASRLARYHLARLRERQGRGDEAAQLVATLDDPAEGQLLRAAWNVTAALKAGDTRPALGLYDLWDHSNERWEMASHLTGEMLLVGVRLFSTTGDQERLIAAARNMTSPVRRHDPSAALRATALIGPLWRVWQ